MQYMYSILLICLVVLLVVDNVRHVIASRYNASNQTSGHASTQSSARIDWFLLVYKTLFFIPLIYSLYSTISTNKPFSQLTYILVFVVGLHMYDKFRTISISTFACITVFTYGTVGWYSGRSSVFILMLVALLFQLASYGMSRKLVSKIQQKKRNLVVNRYHIVSSVFVFGLLLVDMCSDATIYTSNFSRTITGFADFDYNIMLTVVTVLACAAYAILFASVIRSSAARTK